MDYLPIPFALANRGIRLLRGYRRRLVISDISHTFNIKNNQKTFQSVVNSTLFLFPYYFNIPNQRIYVPTLTDKFRVIDNAPLNSFWLASRPSTFRFIHLMFLDSQDAMYAKLLIG